MSKPDDEFTVDVPQRNKAVVSINDKNFTVDVNSKLSIISIWKKAKDTNVVVSRISDPETYTLFEKVYENILDAWENKYAQAT